jgi:hypothetical protein
MSTPEKRQDSGITDTVLLDMPDCTMASVWESVLDITAIPVHAPSHELVGRRRLVAIPSARPQVISPSMCTHAPASLAIGIRAFPSFTLSSISAVTGRTQGRA